MASANSPFTSGKDDGDVRRRNVQSYEKANGGTVYRLEAEDTKKLQKVSQLKPPQNRPVLPQLLTTIKPKSGLLATLDEWEFLIAPLIFTAFAFFTRMWRIGLSPIVTWDEAQ
jgi:dolichyl-phosphate-mannose-protein mannosyltransferase